MIPTEKTSVRKSSGLPSMISGAMYAGEPSSWPVTVIRWKSRTCAIPKSISLMRPSFRIITFSGFTSRWMTPRPCAWPSARQTSTQISAAISGKRGWCLPRNCLSVCPSMNSVTMNDVAEPVPE